MRSKGTKSYKSCGVPLCKNTTIKTPNKLFVYVPIKKTMREKWLSLARRDPADPARTIWFCEDHFDLPNDMENYMRYHVMGSVLQIKLKPGSLPSKFVCQNRNKTPKVRTAAAKRERIALVREALEQYEENSLKTDTIISNSDSSTRTQPEPSPSGPNRGKQCRFCGDFKECSPVVQKPYLMGNKTSLALNHLRVELDFSIDSLPKTICRDCDAKLLETFEFIKQVNTAQFSLVAVCPNNATNANNSVNSRNNKFQHIEIDTQIVKAEFESTDEDSDESKVEIRQDALTLGETIYLRETHKRKHGVDDKKMKKVKKGKHVKSLSTELIIDIKQERMENEDKNSEDSVDFSDTGTEVKPSELELVESSLDYQKGKQTFSDTRVKGKKSSEECND